MTACCPVVHISVPCRVDALRPLFTKRSCLLDICALQWAVPVRVSSWGVAPSEAMRPVHPHTQPCLLLVLHLGLGQSVDGPAGVVFHLSQGSIVRIEILVSDSGPNLYFHPSIIGKNLFSPPCEHTHLFLVLEEKAGDWRGDHTHTQHSTLYKPWPTSSHSLHGSSLRAQPPEACAASL